MAMEGAAARRRAAGARLDVPEDNNDGNGPAVDVSVSKDNVGDEGPITPPEPVRQLHEVGDNVNCLWRRGKWFLGHVTGFDDGKYTVYFLFGKVKDNVPPSQIRSSDTRYPRRQEMIGKDFFFDGADDLPAGMWRVRQVLGDENLYRCTRLSGAGNQNVENFDIGYAIKQYMKGVDDRRESGFGQVLSSRTRGLRRGNL